MSVGSKDRQGPTLGVYLIHVSLKRAGVDCILMRLFASHHTEFIVEVLLKNVGVEFFTSFAAKSDSQFISYAVLKLK